MNLDDLKNKLSQTFDYMRIQTFNSVKGIAIIDSGKSGPCIGLSAMTHGNEPCGLFVFNKLLQLQKQGWLPKHGKIILTLNNIHSAEGYFGKSDISSTTEYRYVDHNMNRLPEDLNTSDINHAYEINRASELLPIWSEFDTGIDYHSYKESIEPLVIMSTNQAQTSLALQLPAKVYIDNIVSVQLGVPAMAHYGKKKEGDFFEFEGGPHLSMDYMNFLWEATQVFLNKHNMMDYYGSVLSSDTATIYRMSQTLIVPDVSYTLSKEFKNFEVLRKGTILATNGEKKIILNQDSCPFLPPKTLNISNADEEVLFLSDLPISVRRIV